MSDRWFTPASARRTLQCIRPTAERLYRLYREIELRRPPRPGSDQRVEPLYFTMVERLVHGLAALESTGVRVDDLRHGMLDFPAQRDGRAVLLCWRVGEPALAFWHEAGDGFDRRPLDENGPWREAP